MTSTPKTNITISTTGLQDGETNTADSLITPLTELRDLTRDGLISISPTDTHVKNLDDAIAVGAGLTKTVLNPTGDASIELALDTIAPADLPLFEGTDGISDGEQGAVPAPLVADAGKFLRADGTWATTPAGTVTEIGMTVPAEFSVTPATITESGTFAITKASQSPYTVFARGAGSGEPSFQALAVDHIPTLPASKVTGLAMEAILTNGIVEAPSATIDLTSIPTTYSSLMLDVWLRSAQSSLTNDSLLMTVNGDTTSSQYISLLATMAVLNALATTEHLPSTYNGWRFAEIVPSDLATAGYFGQFRFILPNYAVTGVARLISGYGSFSKDTATSSLKIANLAGIYRGTASAITQITLSLEGGNILNGSRYALYGVK